MIGRGMEVSCGSAPHPSPWYPVPAICRMLCSHVQGQAGNLSDLTMALSEYDILLCSETLVSDMHHVSQLLVPDFSCLSCCARARCLCTEIWLHTYKMVMEHFANLNLIVIVMKCWFSGFVVWGRTNTHFWEINISVKTEFVIYVWNDWICKVNEEILKNVINIHAWFSISAVAS